MARRSAVALVAVAVTATVALSARPARADVIDGIWCAPTDSRQLSIKGPEIVTPGGTRMQGNYTRHSFVYIVPAAEPGAGQTVSMILVNEETVNLRMGADAAAVAQAPVQVWHRCAPRVSTREAPPLMRG